LASTILATGTLSAHTAMLRANLPPQCRINIHTREHVSVRYGGMNRPKYVTKTQTIAVEKRGNVTDAA
jgi:hypothetical protein